MTIVLGELEQGELEALLETSNAWLLDSARNRDSLAGLGAARDLVELPGEISLQERAPAESAADWLRAALDEVDDHYDGWFWTRWATIEIRGVERTSETVAVAEDHGRVPPPDEGPFRIVNIDHED